MHINKKNICNICGWEGSTHMHHIIRLADYGCDDSENIIEICPNHHAKACEDEYEFANIYNLKGKKRTDEEIEDLSEFTNLLFRYNYGELINLQRLLALWKKYNFDILDAISFALGITRNSAERYVKDKQYVDNPQGESFI